MQYLETLERVYELKQKDIIPDSKESDELEVLSFLVNVYERNITLCLSKSVRGNQIPIGSNRAA